MWSGPRNISTALLRAFENRPDCAVQDEPFYAAFLALTGADHPMRAEILAAHESDPARVVARLLGEEPDPLRPDAAVFYQKHMTHHMVPGLPRAWIDRVTSAFLIREPERVLASYAKKRFPASLADIGFPFQRDLFARVADRLGRAPPVLEASDVLADPRGMLRALCRACAIPFREEMLAWPPGPRASDGVWAPHWYDAVLASTGFGAPDRSPLPRLDAASARIAAAARPCYEELLRCRLRPE
jgi:hypothetical protein